MQDFFKRCGTLLVVTVLLFSLCGCGIKKTAQSEITPLKINDFSYGSLTLSETSDFTAKEIEYLGGFEKTAENAYLALYLNMSDTSVAVLDKRNGEIYFSNSPYADQDKVATEESRNSLYSQFTIEYIENGQFKTVDNYTGSIKQKLFTIETLDKGVKVTYTVNAAGGASSDNGNFIVPIIYSLENDSFTVTVDTANIQWDESRPPARLLLLEHFAASEDGKKGYIFVPDGSGALIDFTSEKSSTSVYTSSLYGGDKTLDGDVKKPIADNTVFPVFGINKISGGVLAIIESGDALASINARRAGNINNYNEVYASFALLEYQDASIGNTIDTPIKVYQDKINEFGISVRYVFLEKNEADYMGMAKCYREYLKNSYEFKKTDEKGSIPIYIEAVGAIPKLKSFLGIQYTGLEILTSFEDAEGILTDLMSEGISNISLRYSGWYNDGLDSAAVLKLKIPSALGGKKGLLSLNNFALKNNIEFYPEISLLTVKKGESGFSSMKDAAMCIDQTVAEVGEFDMVTQKQEKDAYIVSPLCVKNILNGFTDNLADYGISGVAVKDIASDIYADYDKGNTVDLQKTRLLYESILKDVSKDKNLLFSGANVYAAVYASGLTDIPIENNGYNICDKSIPFTAIVLHGLVPYSSTPMNMAVDFEDELLTALSVGALPYFRVIKADNSVIKSTDYSYLCSNNYDNWKSSITETYKLFNDCLSDVQNEFIDNYEIIESGVTVTTFEDGTKIIVNTTDSEHLVNGKTVQPHSFKKEKSNE